MASETTRASAGVQIVRLGAGERRYELDEAALKNLLLRPDVRDLPVVVVSVAGAYRGGKSFILDFFLRYLNAPRSSQMSGEWLGSEDEPLRGFHWRGGSERDTSGIHLWPEPIITTLDTGEKVAVLLMDTQGTFDSETTLGQNSVIFALSTLISSVQVYNLSGNIREDDLQHLQLFTQYGKLAGDRAFQKLLFLVRDWPNNFEHAYGYVGGTALLDKRLQSYPGQKPQLREVREHIRSCFDQIQCFLKPHPGHAIENQQFSGHLRDLRENFRLALLELVPSLLDPANLTPKLINGERVRTEDLFEYFQQYVNIFNSGEMPEAVTIYQGTAQACLLAAARAARSLYAARMEERMSGGRSMTDRTLAAAHDAARDDAKSLFVGKKKLCSQQDADAQLEELIKELDDSLSVYKLKNEALLRETMSLARKAYDDTISKICGEQTRVCLHPGDLAKLHGEAVQEALALFDAARNINEDEEDDQRSALVQSWEQQYVRLCAINEQNNKSAVLEARDMYETSMRSQIGDEGISSDELEAHNIRAIDEAKAFFYRKRNRETQQGEDCYIQNLLEAIRLRFEDFKKENEVNSRPKTQVAIDIYNNYISSVWNPPSCCFHPQALEELHKAAVAVAVQDLNEAHRQEVVKNLEHLILELRSTNQNNNNQAVGHAFGVYTLKMNERMQLPATIFLCIRYHYYVCRLLALKQHHDDCKEEAIKYFTSRRRGATYGDDPYYDDLIQKIEVAYTTTYTNRVTSLA